MARRVLPDPRPLLVLVLAAGLMLWWWSAQGTPFNAPATRVRSVYRISAGGASVRRLAEPHNLAAAPAGPECSCLSGSHTGNSSNSRTQHELVVPDVSNRTEDVLPDVAQHVMQLEQQGKGRKIIAMALYGNSSRYTSGAIENALMARRSWPGWTLRIYYGDGVPAEVLETVRLLGAETVAASTFPSAAGSAIARFFILEDRTVTRFIVRDADARLSHRDYAAVQEWMTTQRAFHSLKDHFHHKAAIMGGMWGAVGGLLHPRILAPFKSISSISAADTQVLNKYGGDQWWLAGKVLPLVKNHTLLHASWQCNLNQAAEWRSFPTQRIHDRDFVGNVFRQENAFQGMKTGDTCPVECRRRKEWTEC